jgi:hypothetical protein
LVVRTKQAIDESNNSVEVTFMFLSKSQNIMKEEFDEMQSTTMCQAQSSQPAGKNRDEIVLSAKYGQRLETP